jgi:hypothetical protein
MSVDTTVPALVQDVQASFIAALAGSERHTSPYRYWLLSNVLPESVAAELQTLPLAPPQDLLFNGRRETNNERRFFFSSEERARFKAAAALAAAFQGPEIVAAIEKECGADLSATSLRLEYCQDTEGFWLEPHTDISVKRFTMSIYLCSGPNAADLGTDIYDSKRNLVRSAPSHFNSAMIFIPAKNTFHGFRERPMGEIRKSIIVNYVTQDWVARHELAFPDTQVG